MHANVVGTLLISTGSFDDDSTALWKISGGSNSIMRIAVGATAPDLDGAFEIDDGGKLDVTLSGFQTTGTLDFTNGRIDVAANSTVVFSE